MKRVKSASELAALLQSYKSRPGGGAGGAAGGEDEGVKLDSLRFG